MCYTLNGELQIHGLHTGRYGAVSCVAQKMVKMVWGSFICCTLKGVVQFHVSHNKWCGAVSNVA